VPTYEYRCSNCGYKFDEFHNMNDTAERKCPICGSIAEKMIGTGSGIIFKGAGFYANDYAKPRNGKKPESCPSGTCCNKD
jgi:putative FmdB family regulatory protein